LSGFFVALQLSSLVFAASPKPWQKRHDARLASAMPTNNSSSLQELIAAQLQDPSTPLAKMDLDGGDSPWGGKSMSIAGKIIESRS
jgi:hypothetical protein